MKEIGIWKNEKWDSWAWAFVMHNNYYGGLPILTPKDIKKYCPDYEIFTYYNKVRFWIVFLSAMAKFESKFNPKCEYKENFKDKNGKYIISRGLFQMSIESLRLNYGYKGNESDIHFPIVSIKWAVRILKELIGENKRISGHYRKWYGKKVYLGGARYWAVLRNKKTNDKIKKICKDYFENKKYEGKTPYEIAEGEIGVKEIKGKKHSKRVLEYVKGFWKNDDNPWCSVFMIWIFKKAGIDVKGTNAWARSWSKIGKHVELAEVKIGDVVVIWRGNFDDGKTGHVTLYSGQLGCDAFMGLGGNQSDQVCIKPYPINRILEIRRIS